MSNLSPTGTAAMMAGNATTGFVVRFDTDNAAFEESGELEVAEILIAIGERVRYGDTSGFVMDVNGNTVGRWDWHR